MYSQNSSFNSKIKLEPLNYILEPITPSIQLSQNQRESYAINGRILKLEQIKCKAEMIMPPKVFCDQFGSKIFSTDEIGSICQDAIKHMRIVANMYETSDGMDRNQNGLREKSYEQLEEENRRLNSHVAELEAAEAAMRHQLAAISNNKQQNQNVKQKKSAPKRKAEIEAQKPKQETKSAKRRKRKFKKIEKLIQAEKNQRDEAAMRQTWRIVVPDEHILKQEG